MNGRVRRWWWLVGLAIAGAVVVVLAPLASPDPDGLERVAIDQGFADKAASAPFQLIPDYTVPGLHGALGTIAAGLLGVLVVFGLLWLLGTVIVRRRSTGGER